MVCKINKNPAHFSNEREVLLLMFVNSSCATCTQKEPSPLCISSAPIRFLSCEPLLEDLGQLNLDAIDWGIVGGESGPKARPMKEEWALNIKRQTEAQHAAFFFKQWGTWGSDGIKRNKHANGKVLGGEIVQQMPRRIIISHTSLPLSPRRPPIQA